ncbi:MAG: hypothetical protein ABI778_02315 [Ignavibacteriota bacterium]
MRRRFLFSLIVIFALASARASIFGQTISGTQSAVERTDEYDRLFEKGIDSLVIAHQLSRSYFSIVYDTSSTSRDSDYSIHGIRGNGNQPHGSIQITTLKKSTTILKSTNWAEEGFITLEAEGKICCMPTPMKDTLFSFRRTSGFATIFDHDSGGSQESFWDSTAIPIIVSLGAAVIIALFFLIRG